MDLFDLCRSIPFADFPPLPKCYKGTTLLGPNLVLKEWYKDVHRPKRFAFQHHRDLEALEKSPLERCFCSLIHDGVTQFIWAVQHGRRYGDNDNELFRATERPKDYRLKLVKQESG
jgi:hypothetical protein